MFWLLPYMFSIFCVAILIITVCVDISSYFALPYNGRIQIFCHSRNINKVDVICSAVRNVIMKIGVKR